MTKLEELIQELCPNGVKYLTIPELFITRNGYTPSKANAEFWGNGTIPWFRMEDIRENGRILTKSTQYVSEKAIKGKLFPEDSIIIATSATIGEHALIKVPSLANQRFTYLVLKDEFKSSVDMMFIFYYCFKLDEFCKTHLNQGNFASVDMKQFAEFKFPLPPLPVQREIVRILDNFTELTAELQEELQARKKQYEYYKSNLLSFETRTPYKSLSDVADVFDSLHQTPEYIQSGFSMIRVQDIKGAYIDTENTLKVSKEVFSKFVKKYRPQKDDIIVSRVGSYGNFALVPNDDCCLGQNVAIIHPNICKRFLFYILNSLEVKQWIDKNVKGASQKSFSLADIRRIPIPIPSLEEQARIVSILDRFDALCNDLTSGLPAEIEARQKQYEYYRDKLLSFHPLSQP